MAINPISGAGAVPLTSLTKPAATETSDSFGDMVGNALNSVIDKQNNADNLAMKAATGQLTDIHDLTIATTEATLAVELTVAVRNKALEAFNEIMRMPV